MIRELDELASRRVLLFGGKGGVGKTTVSVAAALHYARSRPTILFTTDPASNLTDLLGEQTTDNRQLTIESLDAGTLYARFLDTHLEPFLEIGDRGTYLDKDELRQLFELSIPGIDELMAWMHIGELAEANAGSMLVVDTAPTGHTLRMLSSSSHFRQLALALDAMQAKHRALVRQFTRRNVRDAMDGFIEDFDARAQRRRDLLSDPARTAFVPVTLSEPLVVEQTLRLIREIAALDVPFVVLNRAHDQCRSAEDATARARFAPRRVVDAPRACIPLDSAERLLEWIDGRLPEAKPASPSAATTTAPGILSVRPVTFLAGKGGVGKTSCAASIALQLAQRNPDHRYVVISVDPAHSLSDLFSGLAAPPNLTVETIDTKAKWRRFRDTFGDRIDEAVGALTPQGMSISHDAEAMRRLIEMAPPGADEIFAISRLSDLTSDAQLAGVIVDTAPTGHFLRLLDLPDSAGEWVREFMRILLRYRDVIPAGSLGEELVRASRTLKDVKATLASDRTAVVVVTRPERIVIAETRRLLEEVRGRGIAVGGVIANYVTPDTGCACDQSVREYELDALSAFPDAVVIERRAEPPSTVEELVSLVPMG